MEEGVHVSSHPLVKHKLTLLRDINTNPTQFRQVVREISILLAYEATHDLLLDDKPVTTPMGGADGWELRSRIGLVSNGANAFRARADQSFKLGRGGRGWSDQRE